jgi:DNA-binding NarL/FixJ family response regulator
VTIRVLLADDQMLLRATFRLLIDSAPDMQVVGEAANGREAVTLARSERADVVLMDIRMPEVDGICATQDITADDDLAGVKVIMLTTFETEELLLDALRAGASGFLGKGIDPAGLLDAIRTTAAGDSLLSPTATRALISRVLAQPRAGPACSRGHSQTSRPANGRSSPSSGSACPTTRSPPGWSSARPRRRPTSTGR